jgi:DNA gyrase subunit A
MSELRTIGRATQGVRLFKVAANDEISSVAKVAAAEVEELDALADAAGSGELPTDDATVVADVADAAAEAGDTDELAEDQA